MSPDAPIILQPLANPLTAKIIRVALKAITEGDFPLRLWIPLSVEQIEAGKEDPEIKKHFEMEIHKD